MLHPAALPGSSPDLATPPSQRSLALQVPVGTTTTKYVVLAARSIPPGAVNVLWPVTIEAGGDSVRKEVPGFSPSAAWTLTLRSGPAPATNMSRSTRVSLKPGSLESPPVVNAWQDSD